MYFPSRDQLGYATSILTNSTHFWVVKSNIKSLLLSAFRAHTYRPFGDHRGENRPSDPGSAETWCVLRSSNWIVIVPEVPISRSGARPNARLFPSGGQFGSASLRSPGISC